MCVVEYTNLRPTTVHSVGSLYPTVLHHVRVVWVGGTGYELQGVKGRVLRVRYSLMGLCPARPLLQTRLGCCLGPKHGTLGQFLWVFQGAYSSLHKELGTKGARGTITMTYIRVRWRHVVIRGFLLDAIAVQQEAGWVCVLDLSNPPSPSFRHYYAITPTTFTPKNWTKTPLVPL